MTVRTKRAAVTLLTLAIGLGVSGIVPKASYAEEPDGGLDTSLPDTDSVVTVNGRGQFEDLEITVNQTENLGNQAISIKWQGAVPTTDTKKFRADFLQIMQCWGDDDGAVADNPGPPPEQCQFGASDAQPGGGRNSTLFAAGSYADDRIISRESFTGFDPAAGFVEPATGEQWIPFRSVDGTEVTTHTDPDFSPALGGQYWKNSFFNYITTNEIAGARTRNDGTGQELFEVVTGLESSGLGCGQKVLGSGRAKKEPQCWLVIVPRGAAAVENADTIDDSNFQGNDAVMTSALAPAAWANRIAIPLEFNPADAVCDLGEDARQVVGSELLVRAISNWQPALCATSDLPPYSYGVVSDSSARLQVTSPAEGAPGLAVVSRPVEPAGVSPADPIVYAPLALSSMVVGFNIERTPDVETAGPETEEIRGARIANLKLTPRLVAKLLTQSYTSEVAIGGGEPPEDYEWAEDNASSLDDDPDFLRFNPEFELLVPNSPKHLGGLVLGAGTSDAARLVWEWLLADEEAKSWLDGKPDKWGMRVNPVYATTADENASGIPFAPPVPESFPKSDPYCYQAPDVTAGSVRFTPPVLCGTDWFPYSLGFRDAARKTRAALDDAKYVPNPDSRQAEQYWKADGPQRPGSRAMLTLVDSASAAQFGLQVASLSRAGETGDDREFVAPDEDGLLDAVATMKAVEGTPVLLPDPETGVTEGYPLTMLSYGMAKPVALPQPVRDEYAAFVDYAVGDGQVPGEEIGQLPPGYAPLPETLVDEAVTVASLIRDPSTLVPATEEPEAPPVTLPPTTVPATVVTAPSLPLTSPAAASFSSGNDSFDVGPAAVVTPSAAAPEVVTTATTTSSPSVRGVTPASAAGVVRFGMPVIALLALLSALAALEITKRPRHAVATAGVATAPGSGS